MRKPSAWWVAVAGAVLLLSLGSGVQGVGQAGQVDKQGEALLQAAKNLELVKGDLKAAIEQYKAILARPDVGRTVGAKALLEMGLCYEKLGQADARATYEQLLRQYGDQAEQVQAARARLAALGGTAGQTAGTEMAIRRVWSGPGVDVSGAPSPDGRYLSIMDPDSGDLAVWEIATGQKRRLTNKGSWSTAEMVLGSTWSPDGKKIAFAWMTKDFAYDLRIIGSDGSDPRSIGGIGPLAWSPDGKFILVAAAKSNAGPEKLALVSVADSSLTTLPFFSWNVCYSPDGKYFVYDGPPQEGARERDLFIIAVGGKQGTPLVTHPADDQLLGWVPGSDTVLFASNRTGTRDAWALHVVDGKPQGDPVLVRKDIGQLSAMGFSDRGSFYYSIAVNVVDVFEGPLDLAKSALAEPPRKVAQRVAGVNYSPGWSPDGRYLAYVSERQTASSHSFLLCIRSEETGEEREVPLAIDSFWEMRWAADGRGVFATMSDSTTQGLFKIDIQTGAYTPLATGVANESLIKSFAVSPDGSALYYARFQYAKKLSTIARYDLTTGREIEVYRKTAPPDIVTGAISPDGESLTFSTADSMPPSHVIRIIPVTGGDPRDLLLGVLQNFANHALTPDGRTILFINRTAVANGEQRELWQVPFAGGEARKLDLGKDLEPRNVHVHPDGRRIAFTAGSTSREVWVMENFLPAYRAAIAGNR